MRKNLGIGFVCVTLLFVFIFVISNELVTKVTPFLEPSEDNDLSRYIDLSNVHVEQDFYSISLKKLLDGAMPIPDRSIFFHETSCFGDEGVLITARQACAVESAAMMNPKMTIYLLLLSEAELSNASRQTVKQLTSYENVKIRRITMDEYMKNTPLEDWYASGILSTSKWPKIHRADILRYVTLWKFGGIYLDLDVVVTTALDGLTNFAGVQDEVDVACGVMGFSATGLGRKITDACLRDINANFHGEYWSHNGPGVITRVLEKLCDSKGTKDMNYSRCQGFMAFPPSAFYPIPYPSWKRYFMIDQTNETMKVIDKARAIHVWNKLSSNETVAVGSKVPYGIVAKKYCPRTYENCGQTF